ncbi:hypothetical protein E2562_000194 [Oryza meyeriana var. granulata]|uniref:Uncharacterized protein n=1 Tax=Oryza meyeriana var. granulata TaxID=110450 RepID=A0A6G1DDT5_9ORYZ|nr:hypothetical protein E2562_000194 [Oryza meyeriana var. granulata]
MVAAATEQTCLPEKPKQPSEARRRGRRAVAWCSPLMVFSGWHSSCVGRRETITPVEATEEDELEVIKQFELATKRSSHLNKPNRSR